MQRLKSILFENRTLKQTVLKNTFWMTFGSIMSRLIRAVLVIYAARVLGVHGYGVFSYALSLAGFFAIFSDIGITPLLTRESARNPEARVAYLSTAFFIKLVFVAISSLLILFGAPAITKIPEATVLFPIIIFLFIFDTLRDFFFGLTRSLERMEVEAGINIFTNLAILLFGGAALILNPTAKILTIGYTVGSGAGFLAMVWVLRSYLKNLWRYFNRQLVKPILTEAWPLALLVLLSGIMLNTDMLMLAWLRGAEDVGLYSSAIRIVLILYILPGFLVTSLFPTFSRLAGVEDEKFRSILEKGIVLSLLGALPLVGGGVLLAPGVMSLIFGTAYLPASATFALLLVTLLFVFPGTFISNAIFAYNKQQKFLGFVALGATSNAIFNFLLIPPYGIVGSALATIGSQFLANGLNWFFLKRLNKFRVLAYLPKILGATLAMAASTFTLHTLGVNVILNIVLGAIIYFAVLKILKEPLLEYVSQLARSG